MTISLYCNCYKNSINKKTEYLQKNLMLGSIDYESKLRDSLDKEGFIFDDVGDNISHLNKWFGQLTGLYWVWKNTQEEIIGTNMYRLFWGDYFLNNEFKKNTLYIPNSVDVSISIRGPLGLIHNIYDHYSFCHGEINLQALYELSNKNLIPIKPFMIENLKNQSFLHPFNMFICDRNTFNSLCSLLFETTFEFYNNYNYYFLEFEKNYGQIRIVDFLAERILHIFYTNIHYYMPKINIEEISMIKLNHNS